MKDVKVAFSGITGRTGMEALRVARNMEGVEIPTGLVRKADNRAEAILSGILYREDKAFECSSISMEGYFELGETDSSTDFRCWDYGAALVAPKYGRKVSRTDMDVIVDFSHPDAFSNVLDLAVRTHVPLISGTSGLNVDQMTKLREVANVIPVFRGGNFRFKVKKFLDDAVELAKASGRNLTLYENFYEGKRSLPSDTAKILRCRIQEATGKKIEITSRADLPKEDLECQWQFGNVVCRTAGFEELAENVLQIAKVMATKEPGFYELDDIWQDLT